MKVNFFANPPSFIPDIATHFGEKLGEGAVGVFVTGDEQKFMSCLQTADVLWFEWCNELLAIAQQSMKWSSSRVICRLHSYEAFTEVPHMIDWSRVDDLILVNESVKDILRMTGAWDKIEGKCAVHIIPNPVRSERFTMAEIEQKSSLIGYVGHINYKKDSSLLLPIRERLEEQEFEHILCVAGEHQDLRYKTMFDRYMESVKPKNIVFEGYQKDINSWLQDKLFILNTSLFESFNYGIAEGMLCGAIPLVRNWLGVDNVYPHIATWNTVKECVDLIEDFEAMSLEDMKSMQLANRQFILDTYNFDKIIPDIEAIVRPKITMV